MQQLCLFEDKNYTQLLPLTFLRPAYDLLLGQNKLSEKIVQKFPDDFLILHCRPHVKGYIKRYYPKASFNPVQQSGPCLFINGRVVINEYLETHLKQIDLTHNALFIQKNTVVAAYLNGSALLVMKKLLESIPSTEEMIEQLKPLCIAKELQDIVLLAYPEDLITLNPKCIAKDFFSQQYYGLIKGDVHAFAALYEESNMFIGMGSIVEDFVVIDAKKGPVFIDENVFVESHSRLEGPIYIGKNSQILGGKIKNSSIGPACKISGEVSHSIIQGYSNKAHHGFLGHSWVGDWVNLGANTTVSNLKNTYSPVTLNWDSHRHETQETFLGSFIGDHTKTAISTLLNTGTMVGFGSVLLDSGLHPKFIPPFSWGKPYEYVRHELEPFLKTAEEMMKRRQLIFSESEKESIRHAYKFL